MSTSFKPRVYIVILNWNGWKDTLECLESVLRLNYPNYGIVVCDNASTDGSLEKLQSWAEGKLLSSCASSQLAHLSYPPVPKPLACISTTADEIDAGREIPDAKLLLIQTGRNRGFAGGNNVALRFLLERRQFDYVWLLNNDTVVDRDSLSAAVERMAHKPQAGMCGSTLVRYHQPGCVQAHGGSVYNRWVARGGHIGQSQSLATLPQAESIERRMAYVVGASMVVSRSFLNDIGLMNENYFLYFEEIDWATRARGKYQLAYAPKSIVYHKEGQSIGTAIKRVDQSLLAEYYGSRNRLTYTILHCPFAVPTVALALLISAAHRAIHGRWGHAREVCRAFGALCSAVSERKIAIRSC